MATAGLQVGGFTQMTTIDYPDHLAAVVFCQGCPLRCHYCHNPELLRRRTDEPLAWSEILDFLAARRGLLDAVVFSGGEPTLQRSLMQAVIEVKALGYLIGLHTAGIYPGRLQQLLPLVDWVGLDIKALAQDYPRLTGVPHGGESAWRSARLLAASGVPHEIRTTLYPAIDNDDYRNRLRRELATLGELTHRWQPCRESPGNKPDHDRSKNQISFY
ncbi:MAG: anaerobic ribonucleoside-triphosphate reductase activating protein [gamma proteobacterium symbiont of Ctena orbiculata]|uniref:Anaerobic ribonucleoside-triphosphate reductase activating protein n=1 Tax=Candidatus Thiodiazotropha taylori TaxID=2792791 RepID=A0A944QU08_9GAMM|nr:anaerobic ribonucleoside-triphosphate reductase activating protein [Candidatus Thiodiazotropha taylori]PUB86373.1 MAG: anaerobic ribonucleoside-triphosphate reductase activating protein [gamma proteobacterium symbiont of Ctena orbiculata]MBT2988340.1 anaerobic ribonucleoside-triphosphate reductase activating protein [Candidatus Thiodiazotropha taylori]MBT2997247.1 anaerobic ribonucleoside-triphosphate reductase activating protein [Candidatus Thiodiazotropha taylori]MBT3001043.1 anaerobic rib